MNSLTLGTRQYPRSKARLLKRAKALGWSQAELARRCSTSPAYFSQVMNRRVASAPMWECAYRVIEQAERGA
jgi:transcriptional regulator with XRE-family HTH domain